MIRFEGLGVAMVTPFDANGEVDVPALRRLTEHLIAGGVDYLVPLGTTGETATLTEAEAALVVDTVVQTNNGRKPILLGCGGNDTRATVKKLQECERRWQPDGFLSVSPYYNRPTQEGIYRHYRELAQATALPIVLYNVPPRTGSNMEPDTTLRIAREYPHVVAMKEASGSLEQGMALVAGAPDGFVVLSGDDVLAYPGIALGFRGLISVLGNALPGPVARMVHAAMIDDAATARTLHYQLRSLMQLIFREGNPAGIKALLETQGIMGAEPRLPLVAASPALRTQLQQALQALQVPV